MRWADSRRQWLWRHKPARLTTEQYDDTDAAATTYDDQWPEKGGNSYKHAEYNPPPRVVNVLLFKPIYLTQ